MRRKRSLQFVIGILFLELVSALLSAAQTATQEKPLAGRPTARITAWVDDQNRVRLNGNHHRLAMPANEVGAVPSDQAMEQMILVLRQTDDQRDALENLVAAQRNPSSPYYHQWLTPDDFAGQFGIADSDMEQIQNWLLRHGMTINEVSKSKRTIVFSGTASQVEETFNTKMKKYKVGGKLHIANATDPEIPAAFSGVVDGVVSLHDFRRAPMHTLVQSSPEMTSGSSTHYLAPKDFATIYDVLPLYDQGYDGSGQTIAILGRANITQTDIAQFRSMYSLPANSPQVVIVNSNPGTSSTGDYEESMLDVEWSGAVAKGATIKYVTASSTSSSDGIDLAAQYAVNNNVAPIVSLSYGSCEAYMGSAENSFYNGLWQQAAAQGMSVFVSAGDSGAAGCDYSGSTTATGGRAVNGLCSTPYSTCVGGTEFDDTSNTSAYWSSSNGSDYGSALSYIPENTWNESGSSGLWSSGGGVSIVYSKPSWQSALGVPSDGMRDVPDVALSAASHDGYLVQIEGSMSVFGGTSAGAPSFAGLMALVVQHAGARQGNVNPNLYALASRQLSAAGPAVFHDITSGNNTVHGVTGFSAGTGYDQTTGLGSVDANMLVTHWADNSATPARQLTASSSSVSVAAGASNTVTITSAASGGLTSTVAFTVSNLPSGVTATFTPSSLTAPGSGSTTLKLTAASTAAAATATVTVLGSGGGVSSTLQLSVTVLPSPSVTVTSSSSTATVAPGASSTLTITSTGNSTLNSSVSLKGTGLPTGVTATFSTTTISAPGTGTSTLTIAASSSAAPGSYSLVVTATAGTIAKAVTIPITVEGIRVTSSASASTYGTAVTFTATAYGAASSVRFYDGTDVLGTSALSGKTATLSTSSLALGTHSITAAFTDANNSVITSPAIAQSVKGVITVTANNATKIYGAANPSFSAAYSGFVGNDSASVLSGSPSLTSTATAASGAGTYPITPAAGSLAAANYTFKFVAGTLTITKDTPTVTLATSSATSVYGTKLTFTATITPGGSSGTVTFYDGSTAIGTAGVSGTTATFATTALKAGTHSITASLTGTNYNTASSSVVSQAVSKAVLTVSAVGSSTYGGSHVLTAFYSGWVNGDSATTLTGTPALTTSATSASVPGTYPIATAAGTLASNNYSFNFTAGTLTIAKAVLTVTASNATKVYGTANPTFSATYTGFIGSDSATVLTGAPALTTSATATSGVSSYAITPSSGSLAAANYTFKFVAGTLTITKDTPTVTLATSSATSVYGTKLTFTATITPGGSSGTVTFYDGTTILGTANLSGSTATFATTALKAGTHSITASLTGTNYNTASSEALIQTVH